MEASLSRQNCDSDRTTSSLCGACPNDIPASEHLSITKTTKNTSQPAGARVWQTQPNTECAGQGRAFNHDSGARMREVRGIQNAMVKH